MTNGDYIRTLDNERLARFLWTWQVNFTVELFENGFVYLMDAKDIKNWINGSKWEIPMVHVDEDFVYDSEFRTKVRSEE